MSAFASASGPNALSAFPTVALRREGAATANVHAGTVLPEKNSVPSPRWRPHLHRSAAARTAASRTPRPATTNEGRKGANRVTVSPAAVRNQISIPSRTGRRSSTHPVKCPATCLPRFMSASRRIARPVGRVQMTGAPGSRGLPLGYARDLRPLAAVPLAGPATSLHRPPRGTLRLAPGSRLPAQRPQEEGRSEVKRSRAGLPHGEPRTKAPSEAAEPSSGALSTENSIVAGGGAWVLPPARGGGPPPPPAGGGAGRPPPGPPPPPPGG